MSQKRAQKRIQLRCTLEIVDALTDTPFGQVVDLHISGLLMMSVEPMPSDTYQLKLILPEEILGTKAISFEARTAWTRAEESMGFYTTGFSVKEMSSANKDIISALIDKYGISK